MIKDKRRLKRINKIATLLNVFLFSLGAFGFFTQAKWLFGVLLSIVALCNLYTVKLGEDKGKLTNIGLNSLNALVAAITAYDYYTQGTQGLHLIWGLITLMFVVVTVLFIVRNQSKNEIT